jgi:hypothetical protein
MSPVGHQCWFAAAQQNGKVAPDRSFPHFWGDLTFFAEDRRW